MRVVKEAEERRNEILDAAQALFLARGYDAVSTGEILDEVGIARGTLYYHFKSKEDILDAIIARMTDVLVMRARAVASQRNVPVLQRLTDAIMALSMDDDDDQRLLEQAHAPQNALLHQRMQEQMLAQVTPILAGLVEEGVEQGMFDTAWPAEAVEMALVYSSATFDDLTEQSGEQRARRVMAFIYNLERLLGMEQGSLQAAMLPVFQNGD